MAIPYPDSPVRKCYQNKGEELPAVCSQEFHQQLAIQLWNEFVKDLGRMQTIDPEGDLQLGVCPFCQTTITKRIERVS